MIIYIYIYTPILVNICIQRCPKCEHPQWHVQVWDCTARVDIQTYRWWNVCILVTYVCMQRGSNCEHSQGHKPYMWVLTTWVHIQNYPWYDVCILIVVNICMQRGSKCERSQGHKQVWERTARVDIPRYPWYDSWYMYTCEYMYVYNNVLGVSTRKGTNICQLAQPGFIYKSVMEYMYTCEHMYVCKEV